MRHEMSVSRDNQFIATASNDNTVRIWDYSKCLKYANSTQCEVFTCGTPGNETEALAVTWCDSSHSIAVGTYDGRVQVAAIESGK